MDIETIHYKLTHGVPPLSHEECCWLYEKATGYPVKQRKRCRNCNAEGRIVATSNFPGLPAYESCEHCSGTGYQEEAIAYPQIL